MDDVRDDIAKVRAFIAKMCVAAETIMGRELEYDARYSIDVVFGLLDRCLEDAPFHAGDRVALAKTPDITPETSWGWMGSKHFLVADARGDARSVGFDPETREFYCLVRFDDESYVDPYTKEVVPIPQERRPVYGFGESWLVRLPKETEMREEKTVAGEVAR